MAIPVRKEERREGAIMKGRRDERFGIPSEAGVRE